MINASIIYHLNFNVRVLMVTIYILAAQMFLKTRHQLPYFIKSSIIIFLQLQYQLIKAINRKEVWLSIIFALIISEMADMYLSISLNIFTLYQNGVTSNNSQLKMQGTNSNRYIGSLNKAAMGIILIVISQLFVFNESSSPPFGDNYVKVARVKLIKDQIYLFEPRRYIVHFQGSPFQAMPQLVYAIKQIQLFGKISQQIFASKIIEISPSQFTIQVKAQVDIVRLSISYIAIQRDFPAILNFFTDIDVNCSGPLTIINVNSPTTVRTLTDSCNYTQLATNAEKQNTIFSASLTNNKILTFLSSCNLFGSDQTAFTNKFNYDFKINAAAISQNLFNFSVQVSPFLYFLRLKVNLIVYEIDSADSSRINLQFFSFLVEKNGSRQQSLTLNEKFKDFSIMGLTQFQSQKQISFQDTTLTQYSYDLVDQQTPNFRIVFAQVDLIKTPFRGILKSGSTLFVLQIERCPISPDIYYDKTTNSCQSQCLGSYTEFVANKICVKCPFDCKNCALNAMNQFQCISCETAHHRQLAINKTCVCSAGYIQNQKNLTDPACVLCSDIYPKCTFCDSTRCLTCLTNPPFFLNAVSNKCNINCTYIQNAINTVNLNALECVCLENFLWNKDSHTCELFCPQIEKSTGVTVSAGQCGCLQGFKWNLVSSQCEVSCSGMINSPRTRVLNSVIQCNCNSHFKWNPQSNLCWKDCSNEPNSPGTSASQTTCQCNQGLTWNSTQNKCMKDCSSVAYSDGTHFSESVCNCIVGYVWNSISKACFINCQLKNYSSSATAVNQNSCQCQTNYQWSSQYSRCQIACSLIQYFNPDAAPNSYRRISPIYCACISKYIWNIQLKRCEKDCARQDFSTGLLEKNSIDDCICFDGYRWNKDKKMCENAQVINGQILALIIIWAFALLMIILSIAFYIYSKRALRAPQQIKLKSTVLNSSSSFGVISN